MSRLLRVLLFLGCVLVLLVAGLSSGVGLQVRGSFPQTTGELQIAGLSGPVEVRRDAQGIAHLYADTAEDLFLAQGFVQAQDRFWEMDVRRHITSGRLSELFGASQVDTDAFIRTMGWRRVAEQELSLLSPASRRYLEAHAAGVNAYLASRSPDQLSLEYAVLDLTGDVGQPEPWTPVDSIAWLKAMAWDLGSNLDSEIERAVAQQDLGTEAADALFPSYDTSTWAPIVAEGEIVDGRFEPDRRPAADQLPDAAVGSLRGLAAMTTQLPTMLAADVGAETGSNSWVVSGAHTSTGKPILSNDPHLAVSVPSVFHQIGLHCRTVQRNCPFDVTGYSFAGMPGVVIGHNSSIAWGFTTPYLDTQDLVVEQLRGDQVRHDGGWKDLEVRTEQIAVAGEDQPRELRIRVGPHGPLLSDVDPSLGRVTSGESITEGDFGVALQWTALTPSASMDALFALDKADDFDSFRAAARQLKSPSQNIVYADVDGTIGYQLPGDVPIRNGHDGTLPTRGWLAESTWRGLVPFEQLPYLRNPPGGVIVAANQWIAPDDYPVLLGSDPSYGWRSQQLRDRIEAADQITPDLAQELFADSTVRYADGLRPALQQVRIEDDWVRQGQDVLTAWDGRAEADSAGAAYFHVLIREVLAGTFHDQLPEDLWPTGGDRWMMVLTDLMDDPDSVWWDDATTPDVVETRDDVLLAAHTRARKVITALQSRDPSGWSWGRLHRLELTHQTLGTSGIAPVEALFNRGGQELAGTSAVVDATGWSARRDDFHAISGPTMRMVVDLSDLDRSRWINQTGVSGHPGTGHYVDQTPLWIDHQLLPMRHGRASVEAATVDVLQLVPGA